MSEGLEQLNRASQVKAVSVFLSCCGSRRWAQKMAQARPFDDISGLLNQAEEIWHNLETEDWLEAFAAHPKIGARQAVPQATAQSAEWSHAEQSGTQTAADPVRNALAEANRLFEDKFGFIFIVCATGKSAEEMLEICRHRLDNAIDAEILIAADEQRRITEIRLKKLLDRESE
ncbi:MAG: 2-oxo-4-hydroxy-4-carboxy-5-ureidoimidazoline decarboxylase [Pyrinomonadaceae bacterium]